jgi:hypothetical protein
MALVAERAERLGSNLNEAAYISPPNPSTA